MLGKEPEYRGRGSVISESLCFLSCHNLDSRYGFALAHQLIRYYRNVWLDRLEAGPLDDWPGMIDSALERATHGIVIVSDDYFESDYCRREFNILRERKVPITAVVARDFRANEIADFSFDDWIDCRRFFAEPSDQNLASLLNRIPEARQAKISGERADCLRQFIAATENALSQMSPAFASLRSSRSQNAEALRPRGYPASLLRDWAFEATGKSGDETIEDLLRWTERESRYVLRGPLAGGTTLFARMLALEYAHRALRDSSAPLPIWLDLTLWDESHETLGDFIESRWTLISYWKHWLQGNQALFVFDGWDELVQRNAAGADALSRWISADDSHQFILLSHAATALDPPIPTLAMRNIDAALAQKYAKACLRIDQASDFRHLLRARQAFVDRNPLDYLAIGVEFMAADRALAVNQWQRDPMPALISSRARQLRSASPNIDKNAMIDFLRQLAWKMSGSETPRFIRRDAALAIADESLISDAIAIGLLEAAGAGLRFASPLYQWHCASGFISQRNFSAYLSPPKFVQGARQIARWEGPITLLVDRAADDERQGLIESIAEIDPFLAHICSRRHPANASLQAILVSRLIEVCADDHEARPAFGPCLADMADSPAALAVLAREISRYDQQTQLWLWQESLALPIDLPLDFVEWVGEINRAAAAPVIEQLPISPLSLAVAYLIKLARNQDPRIRSNAIWLLGEIKYLPTAALLLDMLENETSAARDEIALALMKYAYSDILSRLLRWSQASPDHFPPVHTALIARGRHVTSRLLALAGAGKLTLNPECFDLMVDHDEVEMALGLAQLAADLIELSPAARAAIALRNDASDMRARLAAAIKHLPDREHFALLSRDIEHVLRKPPESTVVAGSSLGALLYGNQRFDDSRAQAEMPDPLAPPDDGVPDALEGRAKSGDLKDRIAAIEELSQYPAGLALPHLLDLTNDSETLVRLATHQALWRFSADATARAALVAALSDPEAEVVAGAAELLKSMPDLAHEDLLPLLESQKARTVAAAIDILQGAGWQAALSALTRLRDDRRRTEPEAATLGELAESAIASLNARNLADERDAAPLPPESDAATEPETSFSDAEKIERALDVLRDGDWSRTRKAAQFLRRFAKHLRDQGDSKALPLLLAALNDDNWHVRWAVTEALAWLGDSSAAPQLAQRLDDSNWIVQAAAIRGLANLKATAGTDRVIALLRSPKQQVREAAADALGELQFAPAMSALSEAAKGDSDPFVRLAALKAMHAISPMLSRNSLVKALADDFLHLRWQAMRYLAPLAIASDIPNLARLLHDNGKPDWETQSISQLAAAALERLNTPESRAALAAIPPIEDAADA